MEDHISILLCPTLMILFNVFVADFQTIVNDFNLIAPLHNSFFLLERP